MELFSEIYGVYYQVTAEILRRAAARGFPRAEIEELVTAHGFAESGLYLIPRLLGGRWDGLLENAQDCDIWRSRVPRVPPLPLTRLQKAWLRSLTLDRRIRLFLDEGQLEELSRFLGEEEPLFLPEDFYEPDASLCGDPFDEWGYRRRFRVLLGAARSGTRVRVRYRPPGSAAWQREVLPLKFEYSRKDDKFRLYCAAVPGGVIQLNLGRVESAEDTGNVCEERPDLAAALAGRRCAEPVSLRIFPERNAVERCMLLFANYEKATQFDEKAGAYACTLFYDKNDETELLIRVLSFGPAVEVLGPERFLVQVRARVARQAALFWGGPD